MGEWERGRKGENRYEMGDMRYEDGEVNEGINFNFKS